MMAETSLMKGRLKISGSQIDRRRTDPRKLYGDCAILTRYPRGLEAARTIKMGAGRQPSAERVSASRRQAA